MCDLSAFGRKRLIVELLGRRRIETEVELIAPAEFKARLGQRIIPYLRRGMALGQVRRMSEGFPKPSFRKPARESFSHIS